LSEQNQNVTEGQITPLTILDVIKIILKNKVKIILISTFICIISIILYFFVFDLIYISNASVKSSTKANNLMSVLEGGGLPDIGGLDDIGLGGGKSGKELATYEEILNSRRCIEEVVNKFGLMERDEIKFMEDAVKDFKENKMVLKQEKLAGILYVGIYDKDPYLAKNILEYLLQQLDKINIEMNILNAKNNREFIEKRYIQAKMELTKAEDSLKSFQYIYGIAPDMQIKASAQSVFTLEAELKSEEVKLDVIKKILSVDQPEVKLQESKVNSLRSKISEVRNSTDLNDFIRLGNSPQIALSYLRLVREVEIQNKILTFMIPVFEQSKIEEQRETPTILILDKPNVAERKTKPKRLTMVVVLTFFAFVFSGCYYILKDRFLLYKDHLQKK
jgi:capsule polysaccharide export protein KpsE/RkpR